MNAVTRVRVRFDVIVTIDVDDDEVLDVLRHSKDALSIEDIVRNEIVLNLESVSYVESVEVAAQPLPRISTASGRN